MQATAQTRVTYAAGTRAGRLTSAALIVALHALVLGALWQLEPVRSAIQAAMPIQVSVITEQPKVITPPKPILPKPEPVKREPAKPRPITPAPAPVPVLAAPAQAPAVQSAPPAPPVVSEPAPVAAPAAPVVAAAPPPPPAPVIPPRFNADYLNNPPPAYPPIARRMGEEGKVILRVHVNERGLPDDVQIRTSSGSQRLDTAALETVKQWKFVPARRGDTPIDAWVLVPITFSLRS
jgi:periplasmic protein TonB